MLICFLVIFIGSVNDVIKSDRRGTATTIDFVEYLEAMSNAYIEKDKIVNISDKDLWFEINGTIVKVERGSTYNLVNSWRDFYG